MPPIGIGIPGVGDIVSGIVSAFLDIFLGGAREAIDRALNTLLYVDRPDFMAGWFVELYGVLFGLAFLIAMLFAGIRAARSGISNDAHGFVRSFLIIFKQYLAGAWMPAIFTIAFVMSSMLSFELVKAMPTENTGSFSLFDDLGSLGTEFFATLLIIIQGVWLEIEIFVIVWLMPYVAVLFGVVLLSFSDWSAGSKVLSFFLSLGVTAVLAQPIMVGWLVIASRLIEGFASEAGTNIGRGWANMFAIFVAQILPILIFWLSYKRVERVVASGRIAVYGQVRAATNAQRAAAPSGGGAREALTIGAGALGGYALHRQLEHEKANPDMAGQASSRVAHLAGTASKAMATSKRASVAAAAGPLAAVATVATVAAKSSAQKKPAQQTLNRPSPPGRST